MVGFVQPSPERRAYDQAAVRVSQPYLGAGWALLGVGLLLANTHDWDHVLPSGPWFVMGDLAAAVVLSLHACDLSVKWKKRNPFESSKQGTQA
jgi:hypothetical protein